MKRFLIILACAQFFLFQSCKEDDSAKSNPHAAKILSQLNPSDTFFFDLPLPNNFLDSVYLAHLPLHEKWLNLQSLQKGVDSIEIRVWYGCYLGCGQRLVRLFHDRKKWQAEISNLTPHGGGEEGPAKYIDSMSRDIEYKKPRSGWLRFIDSLFGLEILTLPNDNDIPNFDKAYPTDGDWILIEISTKSLYRFYGYTNPHFYDYPQVKKILQIIKLLSTEFNITEWPEGKFKTTEEIDQKSKEGKIRVTEMNLDSNSTKNK